MESERKRFFEKRGWSTVGITARMCIEDNRWPEIAQKSIELQIQERDKKIEEYRYLVEIKNLILERSEIQIYLMDDWKKLNNETSTIARFRLCCESRACQYWR